MDEPSPCSMRRFDRCRHQADGYTAIAAWSNSKQPTKRNYRIEISVREHKRGQMPVKFKRAERAYAMTRTFVPGSHRPRGSAHFDRKGQDYHQQTPRLF